MLISHLSCTYLTLILHLSYAYLVLISRIIHTYPACIYVMPSYDRSNFGMKTDLHESPTEKKMEQKKIDRINELARLKKERPLTAAEAEEQAALRKEYIEAYRRSLRGILDNTVVEYPDGHRESLKK